MQKYTAVLHDEFKCWKKYSSVQLLLYLQEVCPLSILTRSTLEVTISRAVNRIGKDESLTTLCFFSSTLLRAIPRSCKQKYNHISSSNTDIARGLELTEGRSPNAASLPFNLFLRSFNSAYSALCIERPERLRAEACALTSRCSSDDMEDTAAACSSTCFCSRGEIMPSVRGIG